MSGLLGTFREILRCNSLKVFNEIIPKTSVEESFIKFGKSRKIKVMFKELPCPYHKEQKIWNLEEISEKMK